MSFAGVCLSACVWRGSRVKTDLTHPPHVLSSGRVLLYADVQKAGFLCPYHPYGNKPHSILSGKDWWWTTPSASGRAVIYVSWADDHRSGRRDV